MHSGPPSNTSLPPSSSPGTSYAISLCHSHVRVSMACLKRCFRLPLRMLDATHAADCQAGVSLPHAVWSTPLMTTAWRLLSVESPVAMCRSSQACLDASSRGYFHRVTWAPRKTPTAVRHRTASLCCQLSARIYALCKLILLRPFRSAVCLYSQKVLLLLR